ncbi:MAG: hypothetical protein C0417_05420 [Chlorobiaceae bacterium]|nr:hypothetical protein [Chlorobiaceae bacterium]
MQREKLENQFMRKLLDIGSQDLAKLNSRRIDFINGKSMNYCKVKSIKFSGLKKMKEFNVADDAFRVGLEFGINIALDTFNSILDEIDRPKIFNHKNILPKKVLNKLRKSK